MGFVIDWVGLFVFSAFFIIERMLFGCTLKVDIECFSYWSFITLLSIVESSPSLRIKKVSL